MFETILEILAKIEKIIKKFLKMLEFLFPVRRILTSHDQDLYILILLKIS